MNCRIPEGGDDKNHHVVMMEEDGAIKNEKEEEEDHHHHWDFLASQTKFLYIQEHQEDSTVAIAAELNKLSLLEREKILYDLHGVSGAVPESPELLRRSLQELDVYLVQNTYTTPATPNNAPSSMMMMAGGGSSSSSSNHHSTSSTADASAGAAAAMMTSPSRGNDGYSVALASKNPEYVKDVKFRLMFLRAEHFDAAAAARKLRHFLTMKLELFGPEKLCRPITLEDLDPDDIECLKNGHFQLLNKRDQAGRDVVVIASNHIRYKSIKNELRQLFYFLMSALEDETTQTNGIVMISVGGPKERPWNAWRVNQLLSSTPICIRGFHVTHVNWWGPWMSWLSAILEKRARMRIRTHSGTHGEIMYSLMTFGIPASTEDFPVQSCEEDENGTRQILSRENHLKWIDARRALEQQRRRSSSSTNTNSSTAAGTISTADDDATINVATMAISRTATSFNQNDKNLKKTLNNLVEDVVTSVFFSVDMEQEQKTSTTTTITNNYPYSSSSSSSSSNDHDPPHHPHHSHPHPLYPLYQSAAAALAAPTDDPHHHSSVNYNYSSSNRDSISNNRMMTTMMYQHQHQHQQQSIILIVPTGKDVLCGRGRPYQEHSGNLRFNLILESLQGYYELLKRNEKTVMAKEIVEKMKAKGTRFLRRQQQQPGTAAATATTDRVVPRRDNDTNNSSNNNNNDWMSGEGTYWEEVSDTVAREKVSQGFRSMRAGGSGKQIIHTSSSTSMSGGITSAATTTGAVRTGTSKKNKAADHHEEDDDDDRHLMKMTMMSSAATTAAAIGGGDVECSENSRISSSIGEKNNNKRLRKT